MTWTSDDKRFRIDGVGCWCPDERTLLQMKHMGHTDACAEARRGWRLNYANLAGIAYEKRVYEEVGRQLLTSAQAALAAAEKDSGRLVAREGQTP